MIRHSAGAIFAATQFALLAFGPAGCAPTPHEANANQLAASTVLTADSADAPENHTLNSPSDIDQKLVSAHNGFGFDLFAALRKQDAGKNIFLSPTSIDFALGMTYNGAGGTTQQAMAKALRLTGFSLAEVNRGNAALLAALQAPTAKATVSIADTLWADQTVQFDPTFAERAKRFYDAESRTLDLHSPAAADTINSWVSGKTNGKIDRIVGSDDLADADAVLTNAVYFKGTWTVPFDKAATRNGPFTLAGGKQKTLPLMHRSGRMPYLQGDKFQAVSLPYGDGKLSMILFLPDRTSSLAELLDRLNADSWDRWIGQLRETKVDNLVLPRFKVVYEAQLNEPLTALGMGEAFHAGADFRPMGLGGDFISKVKHKAVMEVNEEGTEAAAATAVIAGRAATVQTTDFIVDRPFLCAIRDNRTGAVLFLGAIEEPG